MDWTLQKTATSISVLASNEKTQMQFDPPSFASIRELHRAARNPHTGNGVQGKREAKDRAFRFGNVPVLLGHRIVTAFAMDAGKV
jgi:hypothetical protein